MSTHEHATRQYFANTFAKHGKSAQGLDYTNRAGHLRRIGALVHEIDQKQGFSLNDMGCGYGTLIDALYGAGKFNFAYTGYDLVPEMIEAARQTWAKDDPDLKFVVGGTNALKTADYTLASGIFNAKQDASHTDWQRYVLTSLEHMIANSTRAVIVNFLTAYSDKDHMRDKLYYPNPCELFDFAMQQTGSAAIRHDYGLYDFTLIINTA